MNQLLYSCTNRLDVRKERQRYENGFDLEEVVLRLLSHNDGRSVSQIDILKFLVKTSTHQRQLERGFHLEVPSMLASRPSRYPATSRNSLSKLTDSGHNKWVRNLKDSAVAGRNPSSTVTTTVPSSICNNHVSLKSNAIA